MATVLLTLAGGAGAGGIGLSGVSALLVNAGAAAIDSFLIFPALMRPDRVEGQRLNGMELEHTEEGSPANRLFGKTVRVAGTRIWQSKLKEIEDPESSTKGGSGGQFVRFRTYVDVAVEIGRLKRGKTIRGVSKVFADGKPFYNRSGIRNFTSTHMGALLASFHRKNVVNFPLIIQSDSTLGGPDLTVYQSGRAFVVSGFTTVHPLAGLITITSTGATASQNGTGDTEIRVSVSASGLLAKGDSVSIGGVAGIYIIAESARFAGTIGSPAVANVKLTTALAGNAANGVSVGPASGATANNGTWNVSAVKRRSDTITEITLVATAALDYQFVEKDAGIDSITVSQDDASFSKAQALDIRFYNGSRTQQPDPTILAADGPRFGAANVVAYRGRAYMFVEALELTDFGHIPSFEFIVDVEDDDTLSNALTEIVLDAGLSAGEFDFSAIPSTVKLGGYAMRGPQNLKSALQPLLLAFHLVSQQDNQGRIKLFQRVATPLLDITGKTVAFSSGATRSPRPGLFKEVGDLKTAQIAIVRYFDPDNDLQPGKKQAQGAVRLSSQLGDFNTLVTMTGDEAQRLVDTLFELGRTGGRRSLSFDMPPSYIDLLSESYRVRLVHAGQDRQYLVQRVDEGANSILQGEAVEEDLEAFSQTATAEGTQALR